MLLLSFPSRLRPAAGGSIRLTASSEISLSAPTVSIDTTTLTMNATTASLTAQTTITGATAVVGDTSITGALTNNGHDAGNTHEHLPGSFHAGSTAITGTSGAVTP